MAQRATVDVSGVYDRSDFDFAFGVSDERRFLTDEGRLDAIAESQDFDLGANAVDAKIETSRQFAASKIIRLVDRLEQMRGVREPNTV